MMTAIMIVAIAASPATQPASRPATRPAPMLENFPLGTDQNLIYRRELKQLGAMPVQSERIPAYCIKQARVHLRFGQEVAARNAYGRAIATLAKTKYAAPLDSAGHPGGPVTVYTEGGFDADRVRGPRADKPGTRKLDAGKVQSANLLLHAQFLVETAAASPYIAAELMAGSDRSIEATMTACGGYTRGMIGQAWRTVLGTKAVLTPAQAAVADKWRTVRDDSSAD